jgi:hypothetical protein
METSFFIEGIWKAIIQKLRQRIQTDNSACLPTGRDSDGKPFYSLDDLLKKVTD